MGKTELGAVWLNADLCSAYDYWQYWRNVEDADVPVLLARFTRLPMPEVRRLAGLAGAEINEAKKILATEATAWLHGPAAAATAAETARQTFEEGAAGSGLPSIAVSETQLAAGLSLLEALLSLKLISSKGDGRRHLSAGAVRVNDAAVTADRALQRADLVDGAIKLSVGKKRHGIVMVG
jgi:tyrosyl-tRNA synthetase